MNEMPAALAPTRSGDREVTGSAAAKIGFIGLGIMGRPMARNLLKAGHSIIVHSRSRGPVDEIVEAGAKAAGSPRDVAAQCDVRIASEDAVFGHPEIKFGAPTLVTQLSYIVGGAIARDLCLSGRRIDAEEAFRIGLVMKVVPKQELMTEALAYASAVAEAPLETLRAVKEATVRHAPFIVP